MQPLSGILSSPREERKTLSLISLVIPMYNEEEGLNALFSAIEDIRPMLDAPIEVVCIDDGSSDGTYDALCSRNEPYIRAFKLSRNFGKEIALSAGLDMCKGDVVIPVDADLQEPPEIIPQMIEQWQKGFDVVFAVRKDRSHDTRVKKVTARLFYKIFNLISEAQIPENAGDFRLMDKAVVKVIRQMPERNRFMKGMLTWPGFSSTQIYFDRPDRFAGKSKWKPLGLFGLAIDGFTSFSIVPLRVASVSGAIISGLALPFACYVVLKYLFFGDPVQGYASIMTAIAFFGGFQLLALGIIGEYIGRIYIETKQRPLYIISQTHDNTEN